MARALLAEKSSTSCWITKVVFRKDSYEYTESWGEESENSMEPSMKREGRSCRDLQARDIKTGAVTRCFTHDLRLTRNPTDLLLATRYHARFRSPRRSLSASPGSTFPKPATDAPASRDRTSGSMLRRTRQSPPDPTLRSAADRKGDPELPPDPSGTKAPLALPSRSHSHGKTHLETAPLHKVSVRASTWLTD